MMATMQIASIQYVFFINLLVFLKIIVFLQLPKATMRQCRFIRARTKRDSFKGSLFLCIFLLSLEHQG